jgi:hypothetical protein
MVIGSREPARVDTYQAVTHKGELSQLPAMA